jgi:hypothetical protein
MTRRLITLITGIFCSVMVMASTADLFTFNADQVNNELSQLQSLENFINANPGVSFTDLKVNSNSLIAGLNLNTNAMGSYSADDGEPPLGISSFLWGCCFGVVGILIVYLVAENKEETKKSVKGCVVGYLTGCVVYVAVYFIYYAIYGSYFYSYY